MKQLWNRLEAWASTHAKRSLQLRAGAAAKDVIAAEKRMKLELPAEFRESLLLHDGQERGKDLFEWMPGCEPLASLSAIKSQWSDVYEGAEVDDDAEPYSAEIKNVIFHPRRIPIAGTQYWDGDTTHLDLAPGPEGRMGQVIMFTSECDMVVLGKSFRDALENYLAALESGDWVFDPKKGHVRPKDELPKVYPNEADQFAEWIKSKR